MRISRKGMKRGVKQTRVVLKPTTRGKNKRGTCAHKRTRGARNPQTSSQALQTGYEPREVTAYRFDLGKSVRPAPRPSNTVATNNPRSLRQ